MATYYIDESGIDDSGRNGSVGQEWATLSYACTRVTNGDLIHINSGTYNINSRVDIPVGVSIEGDGDTSILRGNYYTASSSYGILSLYSYPTQGTNGNQSISNLKLDGQDETAYAAIVVFDRSNVKIYNITIENFEMYGFGGSVRRFLEGHSTEIPRQRAVRGAQAQWNRSMQRAGCALRSGGHLFGVASCARLPCDRAGDVPGAQARRRSLHRSRSHGDVLRETGRLRPVPAQSASPRGLATLAVAGVGCAWLRAHRPTAAQPPVQEGGGHSRLAR